jgi:tetratricopeptide (TPR) repeat protein
MPAARNNPATTQAIWLYNPALDLIVGCGAWSAPLLLLAYFTTSTSTLTWSVAFYLLALFFNYPHYMATIYRAYHTREDFNQYRIFTVHVTLLVALTVVLSHVWIRVLPWIFTLYLTASPWHYSGQNYGLFMMFARRAGCQPTALVRRALYASFVLSYLILVVNFHTGHGADPLFVSLNLPPWMSLPAQVFLGAALVACCGFGISRLVAEVGIKNLLPSLTLLSTQCLWFLIPPLLSWMEPFRVPQSRYSTGVLAVMHSVQYLWITSYYAKREAAAAERRPWRPAAYFALLLVGGIALFVPGPWISSLVFHFDFTRSFLLFTALVNLHHFILDGAIWKLRNGRIAALLLTRRGQLAEGSIAAASRTMDAVRWLASPATGARALRIGAAATLLALGTIDQAHYYLSLHSANLANLKAAAALTPYDAPLELRLARQALQEGHPEDSIHAWQYAIKANPADPTAREEWLQYLVRQKQFDRAYALTGDWLGVAPGDATLLVNHGVLAEQFGHPEEAERSWSQALRLDPTQADADLHLALEMERQGKLADAIAHYEAFLAKVAQRKAQSLPPPEQLIGVALKVAACQLRTQQPELAARYYQMARTLAAQAGKSELESFAEIAEAPVQAKIGHTGEALRLYQDAIRIDSGLDDHHTEAIDWHLYALFLREQEFPPRFGYACLLKSRALLAAEGAGKEAQSASAARHEFEQKLGPETAAIRRDLEPTLREALALRH